MDVLNLIAALFQKILAWWTGKKGNDPEVRQYQRAQGEQNERDTDAALAERAMRGDQAALDEIRRRQAL